MPRQARVVAPGCTYHVTQRGNNRQDVFFTDDDRRAYLHLLKEQSHKYGLSVLAFCLMTNHVHLIVRPAAEDSLYKGVGRTHWHYAQNLNRLHGRIGHLWQGRFFSCILDDAHRVSATAYVERNPLRAGMVRAACDYAWSSARAHLDGRDPHGLLDLSDWPRMVHGDWDQWLIRPEDKKFVESFHSCTNRGRPLATDSFLSKLETKLDMRLRPLPVGRPKRRGKSL
jgi:putative transposase